MNLLKIINACALLLLLPVNPIALTAMQDQQDLKPLDLINHYLPEDIWIEIAHYLSGSNIFLNTDLARTLLLDAHTRNKIFKHFIKYLEKLNSRQRAYLLRNFYKTSKLASSDNFLSHYAQFLAQLEHALSTSNSRLFSAQLDTGVLKPKLLKKILTMLDKKALEQEIQRAPGPVKLLTKHNATKPTTTISLRKNTAFIISLFLIPLFGSSTYRTLKQFHLSYFNRCHIDIGFFVTITAFALAKVLKKLIKYQNRSKLKQLQKIRSLIQKQLQSEELAL